MSRDLERQKAEILEVFGKADTALQEGKITVQERDAFLKHRFGTADKHHALAKLHHPHLRDEDGADLTKHAVMLVSGFFVVMVSLFAVLFFTSGDITGAVIGIDVQQTYTENTTLALLLNGTTKVNISGTVTGAGDALLTLELDGQSYTLYEYHAGPPKSAHTSLEKSHYLVGEPVVLTASHVESAYLLTENDTLPLGNTTSIEGLAPGAYTIKLLINDTVFMQEELRFSVVEVLPLSPTAIFNGCACGINLSGNATVRIVLNGTNLTIARITLATTGNAPPAVLADIPDLSAPGRVVVDLTEVFADSDGDLLLYESSHYDENNETLLNGTLTISGPPGAYMYVTYASDLKELVSSNMFTVTFTGEDLFIRNASENLTNATMNTTNVSVNVTVNTTNVTATLDPTVPAGTLCDDPDPNKRPLECLDSTPIDYFRPEDKYVENKRAEAVGKFTPIGNLLIRGEVIEYSNSLPDDFDYQLGYQNANGDFIPTVWINTITGDLHLRGMLTEANANIPNEPGMTSIANNRGIVLALIDRQNGHLIIRGNVVGGRGDLG